MPLFRAPRLFDGTAHGTQGGGAVRVDGTGTIVEVGSLDRVEPAGDEVIDCKGTLIPGLIDCHVHLCMDGSADPRTRLLESTDEEVADTARAALAAHLRAGVTTVRDLGGDAAITIGLMRHVAAGTLAGPRVVPAGRLVCAHGGHGSFLGREAGGVEEIAAAVRDEIEAGAGCVKIVATGGMMTPGTEPGAQQLTLDEMRAAVREATEAGLRVAAHAQGTGGVNDALRAGVATIEHGIWLDEESLHLFARSGAALVPTFNAADGILAGRGRGVPDFVVDKMEKAGTAHDDSFRAACAAGVPIAAGTDAGTPLNPHGSLALEAAAMVQRGLPTIDALVAATGGAAVALGLGSVGILVPGARGDLVEVDGDPTEDIHALGRVLRVWRGGVLQTSHG